MFSSRSNSIDFALVLSAALVTLMQLSIPGSAHAQLGEIKPITLSYEYDPAMEIEDAPGRKDGSKVAFHVFKAGLMYPLAFNGGKSVLIPGARYQLLDAVESGTPLGPDAPTI